MDLDCVTFEQVPESRIALDLYRHILSVRYMHPATKIKPPGGGVIFTHLHHACAGIQKDAALGLFGYLLVFVKVHDVGVVRQLGQLEVALFE